MRTSVMLTTAAAALLFFSCSDDNGNPPGPDVTISDGPEIHDSYVPTETGTPPPDGSGDQSTAPTTLTAHMEEACSDGLYSVNVAPKKETSTCSDIHTKGIDYLQVLVGDSESRPPTAGRTYTVKDQSQVNIYPADGEATAVYAATAGSQNVTSGSFTVDSYTQGAKVFTGSYDVTLGNGVKLTGTYLSDFCPFDPTSCN